MRSLLEKPIYEPPKHQNYARPTSSIDITDAFSFYANPYPGSSQEVVLIKPPILFSKNAYSTPFTMPLGLAYLAAVLDKANYPARIIDCPGFDMNNIRLSPNGRFKIQGIDNQKSIAMIGNRADIIGISNMFSQEWPFVRDYIKKIRQACPKAVIVIGGEHPTAMPEYSLRDSPEADYVVMGEGELAFLELVYKLRCGKSVHDVSGIAYLKDGKLVKNGLAPRMTNIKDMPWPKWDLIDIETYFQPFFSVGIGHGRNMAMLATRGCPYQCSFCSNPRMWTTRYTMRPVKDVVDEIEYNIKRYSANSIDFFDLTAIIKKEWILDFIKELTDRKIHITWQLPTGTRSEVLDEEVLQGLSKTGCEFVVFAPESGSKRILEKVKKRVNLKNLEKSIRTALRYGCVVKANFIIGFPFERRRDMWATLLFIWKLALLKADDANICPFTPYPGSELFDELYAENALGPINDGYFENLMTFFDVTRAKTFCRHVPAWEIALYRIMGLSTFYVLSYLRVPSRLVRLFSYLIRREKFQPRSLFEQRIYDVLGRRTKEKMKDLTCQPCFAIDLFSKIVQKESEKTGGR